MGAVAAGGWAELGAGVVPLAQLRHFAAEPTGVDADVAAFAAGAPELTAVVEESLAQSGLLAADVRAAIVVPNGSPSLLAATFARCPALDAVLVLEPDQRRQLHLFRVGMAAGWGPVRPDECFVSSGHPADDSPSDVTLGLEVWRFVCEQRLAPGQILVVAADNVPAARAAEDVCQGFSRRLFSLARGVWPPLTTLEAIADHCFAVGEHYVALKFYWPVYQQSASPRVAWQILACFSELGAPAWVDRWLSEPAFDDAFRGKIRAELAADLHHDRAYRRELFEANAAALAARAPLLPALPAAPVGTYAILHVPDVPWHLRAADDGTAVLARDEYPLAVRVTRDLITELNPPPERAFVRALVESLPSAGQSHALVGEWVRHAWAARVFLSYRPSRNLPGWVNRTYLVEQSPTDLAALFEAMDLSAPLANPNVFVFVGRNATRDYLAHMAAHEDRELPTTMAGVSPDLEVGLRSLGETRSDRAYADGEALKRLYGRESLRNTLHALTGEARRPLRALFVTSLYTDVLQYTAVDMAEAFRRLGHDSLVLREQTPGDQLHLGRVSQVMLEYRPDFVVLMSHTRAEATTSFPPGLPAVAWLQDELPASKDPDTIARLTSLDLVYCCNAVVQRELLNAGHTQVGRLPFAVDAEAFPATRPRDRRDEIVFATNLPPVLDQIGLEELRPRLEARFEAMSEVPLYSGGILPVLDGELAAMGARVSPGKRNHLLYWAFTIARDVDRIRCADAVLAGGLPLVLYGAGWDRLARFRPHYRGRVSPTEIREVYAATKVTLHINRAYNTHPRVLEGFLAGALVIARHDVSDDLPGETVDQFELGREYWLYRDDDDMVAIMKRALTDEPWRAEVVRAAQTRIRRSHTYEVRAQVVLDDLRRRLTDYLEPTAGQPREGETQRKPM